MVTTVSAGLFQSTRPRGARRPELPSRPPCDVSIHAPAWGATSFIVLGSTWSVMFQSTRPRGARPIPFSITPMMRVFQSTRPRGARLVDFHNHASGRKVSIHAPAWGATPLLTLRGLYCGSFNPRARVGRDGGGVPLLTMTLCCFNPRARVGRDKPRAF